MRSIKRIFSGLKPRAVWALTLTVFVACSVVAMWFGVNAVNREEYIPPVDSYTDPVENYTGDTETLPEVTTKAPNTGDPYMTTVIIELTESDTDTETRETEPQTTDTETTTAPITSSETTTVVTTAPETTAETDTSGVPADTQAPEETEDENWSVILVNPWNPLPDGYSTRLVSVAEGYQADYRVKDALDAMLTDCRKAGYNPVICSAYRTVARQQTLFENEVKEFMSYGYDRTAAEEYASKWVARPGTSEHHTGLAFDIVSGGYQSLDRTQEETPEQRWLMENCYKYGFILRYPDNKTDITGINYEPWHYRYVGLDIATEIYRRGITLEEYLAG